MPFQIPQLRTVNDLIDEGDWAIVREDFAVNVPAIFTTKGDLAVGNGPLAIARLGVGSNGAKLIANPGASVGVGWSPFARARAYRSAQLSLPSAVGTTFTWDGVEYSSDGIAVPGSVFVTIPYNGVYRITTTIRVNRNGAVFNAQESIDFSLYKSGVAQALLDRYQPAADNLSAWGDMYFHGEFVTYDTAGAQYYLYAYHNLGSTLIVPAGQAWIEVEAV